MPAASRWPPGPAPPTRLPVPSVRDGLTCTFAHLHSKGVGVRAKVNVQEKPFSRVSWVEMKVPPPPICERCTSTLQKHFKSTTSSKNLCGEFLRHVTKVRCRKCRQWCTAEECLSRADFLCSVHGGDAAEAVEGPMLISNVPGASLLQLDQTPATAAAGTSAADGPQPPVAAPQAAAAAAPVSSSALVPRRTLPYDIRALHWNRTFTANQEQRYCYCGTHKPTAPTLRCSLCKNWFHHDCTSAVVPKEAPAAGASTGYLPFQVNYDFSCAVCASSGTERFELITCSWIDSVIGAMSNLMWHTQRDVFKVVEIANHLQKHWNILCYRREQKQNWRGPLNSYFTNNKDKFMQQKPYWGLAQPEPDGRGPLLQPCRVLRGAAQLPPESGAKEQPRRTGPGASRKGKRKTYAGLQRQGEGMSSFNALEAVAAHLLLEGLGDSPGQSCGEDEELKPEPSQGVAAAATTGTAAGPAAPLYSPALSEVAVLDRQRRVPLPLDQGHQGVPAKRPVSATVFGAVGYGGDGQLGGGPPLKRQASLPGARLDTV